MIMLISLGGTLTQTRRAVGKKIFPSKGPMWGQYVFFMEKYHAVIDISTSIIISGDSFISSKFL